MSLKLPPLGMITGGAKSSEPCGIVRVEGAATASRTAHPQIHGLFGGMSEIANKSTEQKGAEAEVESFQRDLGPFVIAAETTRMAKFPGRCQSCRRTLRRGIAR